MRFQTLPGFRDFFPADLAVRRWIESAWHRASRAAGFEEIDGPVLEALELFTAKSGAEIAGQLYAFTDKGGREVALRPEMTPTLARMVAARGAGLPKPIKWYSVPEFYRYEKPQRGRLRAFFQWNVDVIGSDEPAADAEAIAVALDALRILGLAADDVVVRINDRRFVARVLAELDVAAADEAEVLNLVDKLARDRGAATRLDDKLGARRADALRALCTDYPLARAGELGAVVDAARELGVGSPIQPDFRIVRGLAYYTGPVWEIFARGPVLRAVAGGGRYDKLIGALGGPDLAALGFGMGDVVLAELLAEKKLVPTTPPRIEVAVVAVTPELAGEARRIVARLRARGVAAETPYGQPKLVKALRAADAAGAARAVILGPEEWQDGKVVVRDLASGDEKLVAATEV
ncbi:MAG TPA: histidine--tRNA ligase [Myxococcota bacterium]|nr:histidine--tRNA ligase [Myxococcota bacterium]